MIIRAWGSRGSIPVSGSEFLKYGGDTTCLEIRTKDNHTIIIDAGSGIRNLGKRLPENGGMNLSLLFTHVHVDHILGLPFFKPLYQPGARIDIYGCSFSSESMKDIITRSMAPPYFPILFDDVKADVTYHGPCRTGFALNGVEIYPIPLSHPNGGVGFKVVEGGKSFVFLTDNELTYRHPGGLEFDDYLTFTDGCDLLFHDAEFTETEYRNTRTWGHSVYKDALRLAMNSGVKQFGLFHHNQDRSDSQIDELVKNCREILRSRHMEMDVFGVSSETEITL